MRRGMTYEQQDRVWRMEDRARDEDDYAKRTGKVWCCNFAKGYEMVHREGGGWSFPGVADGWMNHGEVVKRLPKGSYEDGALTCYADSIDRIYISRNHEGAWVKVTADLKESPLRDVIMEDGIVTQVMRFVNWKNVLWHWPVGMVQVRSCADYHGKHCVDMWVEREEVLEELRLWWNCSNLEDIALYTSSGYRCEYEIRPFQGRWGGHAVVDFKRVGRIKWVSTPVFTAISGLLSDEALKGNPVPLKKLFLWPEWRKDQQIFVP